MSKIMLKTMYFLDKRKKILGRANKYGKMCITLQKAIHELNPTNFNFCSGSKTVHPVFSNRHLDH